MKFNYRYWLNFNKKEEMIQKFFDIMKAGGFNLELINYMFNRRQRHRWHMVSKSPWPIFTAFSAFFFLWGLVFTMHFVQNGLIILFVGLLVLLMSLFGWFRDVIRESTFMGYHTFNVQKNLRFGFVLFILSEIMFFASFFWAYFHCSLSPSINIGCVWPPEGIIHFFIMNTFYLFTINYKNILNISNNSPYLELTWNYIENLSINDISVSFNNKNFILKNLNLANGEWNAILNKNFNKFYNIYTDIKFYNFMLILIIIEKILNYVNFTTDIDAEYILNKWLQHLKTYNLLKFNFESKIFNNLNYELYNTYSINLMYNKLKNISKLPFHINFYNSGLLINPYKVPLLNTIILLTSGATLTISHLAIRAENFLTAIISLFLTICLAFYFILCQLKEYMGSGFSINDGIYGSTFYMLTGFHGFHVIIGTCFLLICFWRLILMHYTSTDHLSFECAIWYWHFVDVVWIILYLTVYLWPSYYFFKTFSFYTDFNNINLNISTGGFKILMKYFYNILIPTDFNLNLFKKDFLTNHTIIYFLLEFLSFLENYYLILFTISIKFMFYYIIFLKKFLFFFIFIYIVILTNYFYNNYFYRILEDIKNGEDLRNCWEYNDDDDEI